MRDTKRDDLLAGTLELVLMYAIGPVARKKTESTGKIALGINEDNLSSIIGRIVRPNLLNLLNQ